MSASPEPRLAALRQRAKKLLRQVRGGDADALALARLHPLLRAGADPEAFQLADAQLVVARELGFESWPKLVSAQTGDHPMTIVFNGLGVRNWVLREHFAASAEFYGQALGLKQTYRSDPEGVATFEIGFGPTLVLECADPAEEPGRPPLHGRVSGLSLEVADIDAAYAEMTARGVPFMGPPTKQYWGAKMAFFSDPGGNTHTLLERPVQHPG